MKNAYDEIVALRKELKRPGVFQRNQIQLRMLAWDITIGGSLIFKRFMDIVMTVVCVILGSPVFLLTAILVKVTSPGPIIFSQVRVGKYGRHFKFYKFRSMYIDAEARKAELLKHNESGDGVIFKMKHDPRITPVGRFIRKFSIDELPQLFNVLLGDMSLVGPRPELPFFVDRFKEEVPLYMVKHQVRPGITGWAQVNGLRGDTSIKERIEHDLYYIEHWDALLDIKILFDLHHFRYINKERTVLKLVEHHFFRLFLFQQDTSIHYAVPVKVLSDPD